jgi:D-arabinose 1-dehydrogenase-like Zn-dependent alcohol dehydrogenase
MATTKVAIAPMKATQIPKAGPDFQIVEREIPKPDAGHVRIKVQACGVCHSDVLTKEGAWPGIEYPRVPGHEVAGIIDELGAVFPGGKRGSASVLAGTAARTARVSRAAAEIFAIAAT